MGVASISGSFLWVGNVIDFFAILITGYNVDNTFGIVGFSSAISLPLSVIFFVYIALKILFPLKWNYIIIVVILLGIIYEIFLFLDPSGSISYLYPLESGTDLIEDNFDFESPLGIMFLINQSEMILLNVIGVFIKSLQYKGIIRKKMIYISTGTFTLVLSAYLDSIIPPGITLIFSRLITIFSFYIIYNGIKEELEKPEKLKSTREFKVEGDLFRLIKNRQVEITEEEITYLKESKKCLVCKGDATGFNIYVCPNCDVLYCQRCARILVDRDNACWSCNGPIDQSKPTRLEKDDLGKVEPIFKKDTDAK